jgi:UDP-2-acetamido-3-amino-2,3-dideoxy-glucuronate N-acetyltransferase
MARDDSVFVHAAGLCESDEVGARTRVWAFAHVMKGARIGSDCNVGSCAFVESGAIVGNGVTIKNGVQVWDQVTIEDDCFLGPNATFTNDRNPRSTVRPANLTSTRVRRGATVGANATVLCGITLGEQAFIGAGAVVTRDVPAHALVVGSPGRRIGWACTCGERLPDSLTCTCGRGFHLISEDAGLVPA